MIYTTLKANRDNNIDLADWYETTIGAVAELFDGDYIDANYTDNTDWNALYKDYTEKQVESIVLKAVKDYAKEKNSFLIKHKNMFLECDVLCDVVNLSENGILTASDLKEIEKKASKKTDSMFDGEYKGFESIDDIIDGLFPCNYDITGECINCGNCN